MPYQQQFSNNVHLYWLYLIKPFRGVKQYSAAATIYLEPFLRVVPRLASIISNHSCKCTLNDLTSTTLMELDGNL